MEGNLLDDQLEELLKDPKFMSASKTRPGESITQEKKGTKADSPSETFGKLSYEIHADNRSLINSNYFSGPSYLSGINPIAKFQATKYLDL